DGTPCPAGGRCGRLRSVVNALGQRTTYDAYNEHGQLTQTTDPNGLVTRYEYDQRLRMDALSQALPNGGPVYRLTHAYDAAGRLSSVTTPEQRVLHYRYSEANELIRIEDTFGNAQSFSYDERGNRINESTSDPVGVLSSVVDFVFDARSRLAEVNRAGSLTRFQYDARGHLSRQEDPNRNAIAKSYDPLGRVMRSVDALGAHTHLRYDVNDRLVLFTDGTQRNTHYHYDDLGNLRQVESPDSGITRYTYDNAGNRVSRTDARGIRTAYAYDALNRLVSVRYQSGVSDIVLTYDGPGAHSVGRLTGFTDETGRTTYRYDARGNLIEQHHTVDGARYSLTYEYDGDQRLASMTYPSGRVVRYDRDGAGRVSRMTLDDGMVVAEIVADIEYQPFGPAKTWRLGNGILANRSFDQQHRLAEIAEGDVLRRRYTHDAASNTSSIESLRSSALSQRFTYDAGNRVETAQGRYGSREFEHDLIGNRTNVSYAGSSLGLSPRATPVLSFAYGDHNRLAEVTENGLAIARYGYNARGQRVVKTTDSDTVHYHYDSDGLLMAETDAQGTVHTEYVYFQGMPIAMVDAASGAIYHFHNDHLGTPKVLTDEAQTIVWEAYHSPFGTAEITIENVTNNLRFPGQYFDAETGNHYNYFRDYDPMVGRYTQSDPIGLRGGVNTYLYVGASPMNWFDARGLARSQCIFTPNGTFRYAATGQTRENVKLRWDHTVCGSVAKPGAPSPPGFGDVKPRRRSRFGVMDWFFPQTVYKCQTTYYEVGELEERFAATAWGVLNCFDSCGKLVDSTYGYKRWPDADEWRAIAGSEFFRSRRGPISPEVE
ncbi:MAG: RHS domain-containing protein, partial [Gammaproteobacteria bacterium]|nr:RHS domain-containing protein [Gammaproteobacteria bacterium]